MIIILPALLSFICYAFRLPEQHITTSYLERPLSLPGGVAWSKC